MFEVTVGGRRVLWSDRVLEVLDPFRQRRPSDKEAGGILLGELSPDAVMVSRVSCPSPRDRRSRFGFVRNRGAAQLIIDHEHVNSGGRVTYLGEWHTHPASVAVPSGRDERMIRSQGAKNDVPSGLLLLAILGLDLDYIGLLEGGHIYSASVVLNRPTMV